MTAKTHLELLTTAGLDVDLIRKGHFTDKYFVNAANILRSLSASGYRYAGGVPRLSEEQARLNQISVGDMRVDMQVFCRRKPFAVVAGANMAVALLRECAGYTASSGQFVSTGRNFEILAVPEGTKSPAWETVMRIRGRYSDFAHLETVLLGVLTHASKIATNVYLTLEASRGKPVLFFPARFDLPQVQAIDGYAYKVAVDLFNREHGTSVPCLISSDAQGSLWGGRGVGTIPHAYLVCFLKDTAEAMSRFARVMPPEVKRIVLVDVNNDCVGDSLDTARVLFNEYMSLVDQGDAEEAKRYVLFGVRPDTAGDMRDVSLHDLPDLRENRGVCPPLIRRLRAALDAEGDSILIPDRWRERAREYFRNVKIVVTGGFTPERIAAFEEEAVPVDMYGVGSYYLWGECTDYTADLVRIFVEGKWFDMAKEGRCASDNPLLAACD